MTAGIRAGECGSNVKSQLRYRSQRGSGNSIRMPFSFICTTHRHVSRIVAVPHLSVSENKICPSFEGGSVIAEETFFYGFFYYAVTAVASINHPRLSLSGTDDTAGTGYFIPPLCISLLSELIFSLVSFCSHYSLFALQ